VAIFLAWSWGYSRIDPASFDPPFALLIYQLLLIAIAIAFPFAGLSLIVSRQKVTDLALSDDRPAGLDGLASVLAEAVADPDLQVHRWQDEETGFRTGQDDSSNEPTDIRRREVRLDNKPIASVAYRSSALDDPSTMEAVSKAVRLLVRQLELEEHLQVQLANLEAARARLLAAADRQQQATAMRLREDVITLLRLARLELDAIQQGVKDSEAREALALALQELALAEADVEALVAGVPPARLGDGRLGSVIVQLAKRSAIPVTVTTQPEAATDADTEAALFYVCSEALTNAVKHSRASRIDIALGGDLRTVALRVTDNGMGGADLSGSGLQGLADRIAIRGGKLRVESPPGAGTTVMATVPR
jgi:signal transduction histidine kinase